MKFINILSRAAAIAAMAFMAACGVNDIYPDGGDNNEGDMPGGSETPGQINGQMRDVKIYGVVTFGSGSPISGVSVTSGSETAITDDAGFYVLDRADVKDGRALVRFAKNDYFPVVRACQILDNTGCELNAAMESVYSDNNCARSTFHSSDGKIISVSGFSVDLPADGFVKASDGSRYVGDVTAAVYYLSPEADGFPELMPGSDLQARDKDYNTKQLVSYGMTNVLLTDRYGNRLQLADGCAATLTFPTPESMSGDAPATMPLWSFDETTGLWVEEGTATRDQKGNYTGTATHFSWWNLDDDFPQAWVEGVVKDENGNVLPGIKVLINNQLVARTNSSGVYRKAVVAERAFVISVPSASYAGYTPEFKAVVSPLSYGEVRRVDITLPVRHYVHGRVTDKSGTPIVAAYEIYYPGGESGWNNTDANGEFRYYLPWGARGKGTAHVVSKKGNADDVSFDIPGDRNIELDIVINSGNGGGSIDPEIIAECSNGTVHYLEADKPLPSTLGGVIVQDRFLTVISRVNFESDIFALQVNDYDPSRSEYTDFMFQAVDGSKIVQCMGGKLSIREENDVYTFNLTGKGVYAEIISSDGEFGNPCEATITVNNVGISHLMTIERRENYTPASPMPSVTPKLSAPAPVALIVTKSQKMGLGGWLYYNGDLNDFDALKAQADRSGYTMSSYDKDSQTGYAEVLYTKDNNHMMIEADSDCPVINAEEWRDEPMMSITGSESEYAYESQLIVTSFAGGTLSLQDIMEDLDDEDSFARSAKRILRKAAKRL